MNTQLEILEITDQLITVQSGEEEIEVSRPKFEAWLSNSGKLDWCNDIPNGSGEHIQQTGTLDLDEYYSTRSPESDLAEFLTTRQPMTGKIKDMGKLFEQFKSKII